MTMAPGLFRKALVLACVLLTTGRLWAAPELKTPEGPMPEDAPGLRVGDLAPDFTAKTGEGERVMLSELLDLGPVVLIFYRGAWCPYCNLHLHSFGAALPRIREKGASVVAVSIDVPQYASKMAVSNLLGFPVVSDPKAEILDAYGLRYKVPDELAEKYLNEYKIDLEAHSGRTDHVIAVPATYVIAQDRRVVFAYADRYHEARSWLATQLRAGRLKQRLHVLEGLSQAPAGLGMLFRGENTGKLVVRVA